MCEGKPFCERTWPTVPRKGEIFHQRGTNYLVDRVAWDDDRGVKPTTYVYLLAAKDARA
jgi:hypothetical protein